MSKSKTDRKRNEEYSTSFSYSLKDVFGIKPRIEITGNTYATVEGCKGVLEYTKTQIRVSLGSVSLLMKGRGLNLRCISPTSLIIEGFIIAVEYIM